MDFSGTFELEEADIDDVWLALSDPAMVQHALPGCEFLVRVDDENPDFDELREAHMGEQPELTDDPDVIEGRAFEEGAVYAALVETSVGSVNPSFETVVTVDEREKPRMAGSGEGSAGNSSFEMDSGMELSETDDGVAVEWSATADVFGRLAQLGQRMINPVANRMVKQFFGNLQDQLGAFGEDEDAGSEAEGNERGDDREGTDRDEEREADTGNVETGGDAGFVGGIVARLKRLLGIG